MSASPPGSPSADSHDVIVIGAGHNGLVAGNYLAGAGYDVLVVEAGPQIGGMSSSAYSVPEAPQHMINHCAVDPILWTPGRPARELGLERHGLRVVAVDPPFAYLHPDGASIAFWHDPRKTAAEIERFSRADARAFLEFAEFLDSLYDVLDVVLQTDPVHPGGKGRAQVVRAALKHRKLLGRFGSFLLASGKEVIADRFTHPMVRAALHVSNGSTSSSSLPGSAIQFTLLASVHRFPCWRPLGGIQALPDALAARLRSTGGTVRVDAPVARIMLDHGRARGVTLSDGTEIAARQAVVATCDPKQALAQLLPSGTLTEDLERRVRALPTNGFGWGQMKIDVACSARIDMSRHRKQRKDDLDLRVPSHWIGTEEGIERAYAASSAGLMPATDDLVFYNAVPTANDPSQAPEGQDTLYVLSVAVPNRPAEGWDELKDKAAAATMHKLGEFYGNLSEIEIGKTVHTHEDIAKLRHVSGGVHTHVDMVLGRSGPRRPTLGLGGYRTPVDGLYLAGSGSHPGGGVTGMPGYLGAQATIRGLRKAAAERGKPPS
jgi:phytoene dehydrogenase-like protein